MAYIFSLSAECGNLRENAETFTNYFQNLTLKLSDGLEILCSSNIFRDGANNWWSLVNPTGIIVSGRSEDKTELCKTERTSEVGFLLYEHLKTAPPFRYAIVGWEVDGFREFDDNDLQTLDGLVFSQEFCEKFNCFSKFKPFATGYYWQPYRGETWQP
jgi:hypothetical protein